ncbi:class III peroxidase [Populus alba x Populus x berolinensis]|nr:class III peroxidase [Populus alba x Populus x berolinensis]
MERGCMLLLMMVLIMDIGRAEGQLVEDFYSLPRPNVEALLKKAVSTKFNQTFTTIPATLPLFFHDCFVTGCDASTMGSSPNGDAEKDAPDNLSLAGDGFDTVVKAKQEVEGETIYLISIPAETNLTIGFCVIKTQAGDPSFDVELGRRDGLVSKASLVKGILPEPGFNLSRLNAIFAGNNLSQIDMIALSGAHALGFSNCSRFVNRLYSFPSSSPVDPSLNQDYAKQLMEGCP